MKLRGLYATWTALGLASSSFLVFAGGGHPAPIIFLPIVVAVWIAGHLALVGAGWLARRGAAAAAGAVVCTDPGEWSLPLRIAVAACGLASLMGLIQLVVTALLREMYPFRGALWAITLVIWGLHGACLAGLLLLRPWARRFAALLSFGWSALMAWQIVDHFWYGPTIAIAIEKSNGSKGRWLPGGLAPCCSDRQRLTEYLPHYQEPTRSSVGS